MKEYFLSKLSDINYKMATHEGNANRRLASQSKNILLLPSNEVSLKHHEKFHELKKLIEETIKNQLEPSLTPTRLLRIQNRTALKYIGLLLDIEDEVLNC